MRTISLPVVSAAASLDHTLKQMGSAKMSAVVVSGDGAARVVNLHQIVRAYREQRGPTIGLVNADDHTAFVESRRPSHYSGAASTAAAQGYFTILSVGEKVAQVLTDFEWHSERAAEDPIVCVCVTNSEHRWTPDELLNSPGQCPEGDGPVMCRSAGVP